MDIESFLREHGISFQKFEHPAVFTCEESERLCPPMPGVHTKNLFLRNEKGQRYFLVVVSTKKRVDLKALKALLGVSKLSFGAEDKMIEYLGVGAGSATVLGAVMDREGQVEVVLDEEIWNAKQIGCHPLRNTATVVIAHTGLETFLKAVKHQPRVLLVPERSGQ
ncbi:prolyl-tRNA synthetase associated domain-containing protein [Candidatus Peregrinibacteria bacterium]|nr:prolyl-tRNA synthetase associated domain-containing protein [Candidatus Peregrinibacteria bacterium]